MNLDIRECGHLGFAQRWNEVRHLRCAGRWVVASRAANRAEQGAAGGDRRGTHARTIQHNPGGWWWRQEAHEVGKGRNIIKNASTLSPRPRRFCDPSEL